MRREYPRVPGPGRAIAITLLVLAALAVGGDFAFRELAEARVAAAAQVTLDLQARPEVEVPEFPFTLGFARGRFDRVDVTATAIDAEGLAVDELSMGFEDVVFDRGALVSGSGTITAGSGSGEATLDEDAVSTYLQDRDVPVRVRFVDGRVRVTTRVSFDGAVTTASAEGEIVLGGDPGSPALVFEAGDVEVEGSVGVPAAALSFQLALPELVPGISYRGVRVEDGVAVITAGLAGARIEITG